MVVWVGFLTAGIGWSHSVTARILACLALVAATLGVGFLALVFTGHPGIGIVLFAIGAVGTVTVTLGMLRQRANLRDSPGGCDAHASAPSRYAPDDARSRSTARCSAGSSG